MTPVSLLAIITVTRHVLALTALFIASGTTDPDLMSTSTSVSSKFQYNDYGLEDTINKVIILPYQFDPFLEDV